MSLKVSHDLPESAEHQGEPSHPSKWTVLLRWCVWWRDAQWNRNQNGTHHLNSYLHWSLATPQRDRPKPIKPFPLFVLSCQVLTVGIKMRKCGTHTHTGRISQLVTNANWIGHRKTKLKLNFHTVIILCWPPFRYLISNISLFSHSHFYRQHSATSNNWAMTDLKLLL